MTSAKFMFVFPRLLEIAYATLRRCAKLITRQAGCASRAVFPNKHAMMLVSAAAEGVMRFWAAIAVALFFGAAPAFAWQEYLYADQGVAIQFPAKPQAKQITYDCTLAKGLPAMVYAAEDDHVRYSLTAIDLGKYPDRGANFLNEAAFRLMQQGDVLFTDFPRVYQDVKAIYGVTVVVDRMDGTRVRSSLYYNKGRLYIADATVLPARGDKDMAPPSRYDQTIRFPPDGRFD